MLKEMYYLKKVYAQLTKCDSARCVFTNKHTNIRQTQRLLTIF